MISVLNPKKIIPKLFEHKTYYLSLAFVFTVVSLADMVILYHYISAHSTHSLPRITSVSTHQVQSQAMPTNSKPVTSTATQPGSTKPSTPVAKPQTVAQKNALSPLAINSSTPNTTTSSSAVIPLFFGSIDTMKDSRDTDYPTSQQMTETQVQQEVNLIAAQNANYITDDAFYDYPSYMALWANVIHAAGKHVWFRPHFNCWELDNGCSTQMTPSEYLFSLTDFINTNYEIFKPGDIFDPCSEPEDSNYWQATFGSNWSWQNAPNNGTNAYNNFMINVSQTTQSVLEQHGIDGVITNIRSTNSWWPQNPASLYPSTIKTLGYITYDSYPEGTTTDPATAATSRIDELNSIIQDNPGIPIILGEFGYSNNVDVNDTIQASVLSAEINAITPFNQIVGLNYWVGAGGPGYGGYTNIFTGARGSWQARPGAAAIAKYFTQKIN